MEEKTDVDHFRRNDGARTCVLLRRRRFIGKRGWRELRKIVT